MKCSRLSHQPHTLGGIRMNNIGRNPNTVTYGTESKSFLAPKIWSVVPREIKNCKSLDSFQKKDVETNLPMPVM